MSFLIKHFHIISIPPLLPIAAAFIFGIIGQSTYSCATTATFILFLVTIFLFYCFHCAAKSYFLIKKFLPFLPKNIIILSFFSFAGAYLYNKQIVDHNEFYVFTKSSPIEVTGVVIDKGQAVTQYSTATIITVSVSIIKKGTETQMLNKNILFYTKENGAPIIVGDTIKFLNVYCKQATNESFDLYQIKEQTAVTVFNNQLTYEIIDHPQWSLRRWIFNQKQRILDGLAQKLSPDGFRFFASLFLGNRACIKASLDKTNEQFKTWGISHFLARSGLHLALFIFIWQALFCIVPLPFKLKQIIITFLSCTYFILTWTSAPFTRSFALFLLHKLCVIIKLPFHLLHYLTVVCFGFLLYCPLYLFFLDFQLSFALTFALSWFNQLYAQYRSDN